MPAPSAIAAIFAQMTSKSTADWPARLGAVDAGENGHQLVAPGLVGRMKPGQDKIYDVTTRAAYSQEGDNGSN